MENNELYSIIAFLLIYICICLRTYPDVELGSTSGQESRRLQNTNGGLSGGAA